MIDHHVHLGTDCKTGFSLTLEELLEKMELFGLDKSVVFSPPNVKPKINPYQRENEQISSSCKDHPRIIPFMFVHPFLDEIEYLWDFSPEFQGFKLSSRGKDMEYHYQDLRYSRVIDFLLSTNKPLLFHTGYRDTTRIKHLIKIIKDTKSPIVFAHAGDLIEEDLIEISQYENVFIDISPMATMLKLGFFTDERNRPEELKKLTIRGILSYLERIFGKKRIVWGSDSPWCDNLLLEGYKREIEVGRLMFQEGFNSSYLNYEKPTP